MNYLEKEIDSTLVLHALPHEKLSDDELSDLITKLTTVFFSTKAKYLDPYQLKSNKKLHDPEFWKKVDTLENLEHPLLIVQDSNIHAWKLENSLDLKKLFSETTGFPFWIADDLFNVLIHMDDHDCVHISNSSD